MKLVSLTSISRADWFGSSRSSSRAAAAPAKPPPAMTTFQAMYLRYVKLLADQPRDLAAVGAALRLAHDVADQRSNRLHVAVAHLCGGLGIRLDRGGDD